MALACGLLWALGCSRNRIDHVAPTVFKSLPGAEQQQVLSERTKDLRVVQGKIAKTKTDLKEQDQEIKKQAGILRQAKLDYQTAKKAVRGGKKANVSNVELSELEHQRTLAKHELLLAKERFRLAEKQKKTLNRELDCLDSKIDVVLAGIEMEKIKAVHAFAKWQSPAAHLQVAQFKRQLRKFEVREARLELNLAKAEYSHAHQLQKILTLEKGHPNKYPAAQKSPGSSDKPWTNIFISSTF